MVTTRRNAASSVEPSQSASEQASQRESPPVEPSKKRSRKGKASAAQVESQSQSVVESHAESSTKGRAASRAASSAAATAPAAATTVTTSTTATVSKRVTRSARETTNFSPLRALSEPQPKRQTQKKHTQKHTAEHTDSDLEPEPVQSAPAQDENDSESGMFFTQSEHNISSPPPQNPLIALPNPDELALLRNQHAEAVAFAQDLQQRLANSERLRIKSETLLAESERLRTEYWEDLAESKRLHAQSEYCLAVAERRRAEAEQRLAESERLRAETENGLAANTQFSIGIGRKASKLERSITERDATISELRNQHESPLQDLHDLNDSLLPQSQQSSRASTPLHYLPLHRAQQSSPSPCAHDVDSDMIDSDKNDANVEPTEFDSDMMGIDDESTAEPIFISGTEKAMALLHKIENAAKESTCVKRSHDHSECGSDDGETPRIRSPHQPRASISSEQPMTPARAIASPSGFFSKSLSMLKAKFGFVASTPLPPPSPEPTQEPTPKSLAPFTEMLSVPPTPEPTNTPARRRNVNPLLRTLVRGVTAADMTKARQWAKPVVQQLRTDPAFRDKRKRLETPVLAKDLKHYPSSKPWENGFGDPLFEFDDDDVVPVWAVYLSIVAEEDTHRTKRRRSNQPIIGDFEMSGGSLNEQYAAAISAAAAASNARSTPELYNSHGNSADLHDFHPRRSTDPSPLFDTPVVHQQGDNVFREAKGYDTTAKIREDGRESLQQQTKQTINTHNPNLGSFSVPDGSDEEDNSMTSETSDNNGAPLWTQPPPPAPVPAHAPLPGGPPADAPSVPAVQQPVDKIERQRQKLMKHTPAKPSRLREATYPSPSILSEAGNESVLAGSPGQLAAASLAKILGSMPGVEPLDIDEEDLQAANALQASSEWKAAATSWPAPILTYDSEEESVSPV